MSGNIALPSSVSVHWRALTVCMALLLLMLLLVVVTGLRERLVPLAVAIVAVVLPRVDALLITKSPLLLMRSALDCAVDCWKDGSAGVRVRDMGGRGGVDDGVPFVSIDVSFATDLACCDGA